MISPDAHFEITRLPLDQLVVTEYQPRSLERLTHYVSLMRDPRYSNWAPGFISVAPYQGRYRILDGHHRYLSHVLVGRAEALCLVIDDPSDPAS